MEIINGINWEFNISFIVLGIVLMLLGSKVQNRISGYIILGGVIVFMGGFLNLVNEILEDLPFYVYIILLVILIPIGKKLKL
ncbi:hypothetical protein N9515_09315 [Vicingaceae bacterium]|nr:hypothetical protein [Vicingaceae bacterium]